MNPVNAPRHRFGLIAIGLLTVAAGSSFYFSRSHHGHCKRAGVPWDYRSMTVADVAQDGGGYAVALTNVQHKLTIYVGSSEGQAIRLRNAGQRFVRPLTVDLLDSVMTELGGTLDHVRVDALVGNTFHGSLHVRQGARTLRIDARPSDAIALALGHSVPIMVSDQVIAAAAHPID
jgi:uncharacterized protein